MPRHSPNALTSHLRVHTTNDKPELAPMMRMIVFILSQYSICVDRHDPIDGEPSFKINRTSAASIEKPIHNVKVPMDGAEAPSKLHPKMETRVFISGTN